MAEGGGWVAMLVNDLGARRVVGISWDKLNNESINLDIVKN